ncbi:MAG: DUF4350 domain-containing protein [Polyangiaceae bacterium]
MALKDERSAAAANAPARPAPAQSPPAVTTLERWQVGAYVAALVLLFIGERVLPSYETARWVISGLAVVALVALTALRFVGQAKHQGERRAVERTLAFFSAGGVLAVAIYFATTDTGKRLLGVAAASPDTRSRFEGEALVVWVVLLLVSVLPLLFGERALAPMRGAERIEARRVRSATLSGLTLAAAAAYCALVTYAVGELDYKADFSYFRTARPSDSTKNIVQSMSEPVKVMAFFPELSEVGTEVRGYLDELRAASGEHMSIEVYDRLMVPAIAKDAKVTQDGTIVLMRDASPTTSSPGGGSPTPGSPGGSRETLSVGNDMKTAAAKLKTLDGDFQKVLLKVLRSQRTAYFTVGHGEINEPAAAGAPADGRSTKTLKKVLEQQNYTVKDLGLAQGLANEIPKDAHIVLVLGPARAFTPEEVAALSKFADRGGKLLLALDPESKAELGPLAEVADVTWQPGQLATDDAKHFYPRRRNPSDHATLITNRFSSHASVTTLSRNSQRAAVVFPGASSLDKKEGSSAKVDFAVRAFGDAWIDLDGNFEFDDKAEKKSSYNLVAAVSRPLKGAPAEPKKDDKDKKEAPDEMRAFVLADADVISDAALGNEANLVLAVDALRWLGGEESFIGQASTAEDVRIEHTKQKDVIWFYGTIFAAPALVLGLGLLYTRRVRSKKSVAGAAETMRAAHKAEAARERTETTLKTHPVAARQPSDADVDPPAGSGPEPPQAKPRAREPASRAAARPAAKAVEPAAKAAVEPAGKAPAEPEATAKDDEEDAQ